MFCFCGHVVCVMLVDNAVATAAAAAAGGGGRCGGEFIPVRAAGSCTACRRRWRILVPVDLMEVI